MDNPATKPTPTHDNQILIHPEHAAGTLIVPTFTGHLDRKTVNIFASLAVVVIIAVALFGFLFIPKTQSVMFAQVTASSIDELGSKTKNVNDALDILYQSLTASSSGDDSGLSEIKANVLSANTSIATNSLLGNSVSLLQSAEAVIKQEGVVKGFSIPETDPNKAVREQRKLAESVSQKVTPAQELLSDDLSSLRNQNVPSAAEELQKQVEELSAKTEEFLSEADKTSKYYVAISDAAIDIFNISNSLTDPKDISNSVSDLTKIRNRFADYDKASLPSEIGDLNQDIVAVFDLLINFFKEVDSGTLDNQSKLLNSLSNFINETKGLAVQTSVHELNFWQNNQALSSYPELIKQYEAANDLAETVKTDNNYFLLPLLGVK